VTGVQTCALPISRTCSAAAARLGVAASLAADRSEPVDARSDRRPGRCDRLQSGWRPHRRRHARRLHHTVGFGERRTARLIRVPRSEEHTSELQSLAYLVCRLLLEKKKRTKITFAALCDIRTRLSN